MIELINGDCLEKMNGIKDGSIDLILTDPPYGTTRCKWDSVIDFDLMWKQLKRVIKKNGAIVLFGSQPFTSALVMSNPKWFRYSLVYEKSHSSGHLNANKMPMRKHEDVLIFYKKLPNYNPQKTIKKNKNIRPNKKAATNTVCYGVFDPNAKRTEKINIAFPHSIIKANNSTTGGDRGFHPTQKPVALMEYLIKTYTIGNETILDFTMGSGTTGVACVNTNRNFIGIELDKEYFEIAKKRIEDAQKHKIKGQMEINFES